MAGMAGFPALLRRGLIFAGVRTLNSFRIHIFEFALSTVLKMVPPVYLAPVSGTVDAGGWIREWAALEKSASTGLNYGH
jgi:hypothetical protein